MIVVSYVFIRTKEIWYFEPIITKLKDTDVIKIQIIILAAKSEKSSVVNRIPSVSKTYINSINTEKNICFRGISWGCRSVKTRFLWRMLQTYFQNVAEKPKACQKLSTTSPNSPTLSAAINGQAVRQSAVRFTCVWYTCSIGQEAVPFKCMIRPYACVLLIPLLVLLSLLLLYEYRDLPLLLLHAAAVAVVTLPGT